MARQHMTRFLLEPGDDGMHPHGGIANYNESVYVNLIDPVRRLGGWFRLGNRVNEGHAEMSACLYLPDGRVAFMHERPAIADNDRFDAGGMRIAVGEPFRRLTLDYSGPLCVMREPRDMADPSRAFKVNPVVAGRVHLALEGVAPMHGGVRVLADGSPLPDGGFARGHTEQHVAGHGELVVGDERWTIQGYGLRDHSWGPRHWSNIRWYRWLPMNFGRDFAAMVSIVAVAQSSALGSGMVLRDGAYHRLEMVSISPTWDEHHHAQTLRVWMRSEDEREYELDGTVLSLIPLRHRRTASDGTRHETRITEGLTVWRCRELGPGAPASVVEGFGIAEFLDQIDEHGTPVGFVEARPGERLFAF